MKKLAIIVAESFNHPRGQALAEINRINYLKQIADYQVDVFSFSLFEGWLTRKLRHTAKAETPSVKQVDGFDVNFKWRHFSLIDYILNIKLHFSPIINKGWTLRYAYLFKDYDLIMAHSDECGELALKIHQKYGIPYCVTWHGSDIHTSPFASQYGFEHAKAILDNASVNFIVSRKLKEISEKISTVDNKVVLYNGINSSFQKFDSNKRKELRQHYGVADKKVVAFVGNLFPVKNPMSLPKIFKNIYSQNTDVAFWIIGTGKFQDPLKHKFEEFNLPVEFCGDVSADEMPDRYNSIDVLVLPSINEGLPLVVVEALACGANVVGSEAGGIPEVVGKENSFDRNDNQFAENVANRIVYMLANEVEQELNPCFSWAETAKIENEIYLKIFNEEITKKYTEND